VAKQVSNLSLESESIRDVYAHFGLALYLAQGLERQLSQVLALDGDTSHITAWDFDARLAENYQSTFGDLVSRFSRSHSTTSAELCQRLQRPPT